MYRICLINVPFASFVLPSIALTQLKSVIEARFPKEVSVDIVYLNLDFAKHYSPGVYQHIANSLETLHADLGDWYFRQVAFPELLDNTEKYLRRYFWNRSAEVQQIKNLVAGKRGGLDAFMDELILKYELDKAQVVGFSSLFMQNMASFAFARKLKQRNQQLITVMGGANCEFPMGKVIAEQVPAIDFVFSGPALKNFPEFIQHCMQGNLSNCRSIRGVLWKGSPEPQSPTETLGEELNIDTHIELDYETFVRKFEDYFHNWGFKPMLPVETSRGCWWGQRAHCTFCGLNGASMGYRAMKPDLAIRQFKSLFCYSGRASVLQAVDNILPKSYLTDVMPFLEPPEDLKIFYEVKADLTQQEMGVLAKARVTMLQPGIESLATSTLKLMKKGTTSFQNVSFLKNCAMYGIKPFWNLLVGFPGENIDVYQRYLEIIPQLTHLEPPSGVYPVRFDRFSPYFYQSQSYGLDLHPTDSYTMTYPFEPDDLSNLAYYFADRNLKAQYVENMTAYIHKLRVAVGQWQIRWATAKHGLPPRLYFQGDSDVVYDSRSGAVIEHCVGKVGKAILDFLAKPVRVEELVSVLSAKYGSGVVTCIASLEAQAFVFREGDRLLSLVLQGEHGFLAQKLRQECVPVEEAAIH